MKKNIIIVGVPRAGKTTLTKMILKKYSNYNLIQEDILEEAIHQTFKRITPQIQYNEIMKATKEITNILQAFIFKQSIVYEPDLNYVLDTNSLPLKACKYLQQHGIIVIVLAYPNETPEGVLKNIREHDTQQDWTRVNGDAQMACFINAWLSDSKRLEKEAKKLCLKFVNTGKNREQVLEETMNWLDEKIKDDN